MKQILSKLFIVFVVLFQGCGPSIQSGEVLATSFEPEHQVEYENPDIKIDDITIPGGTYTVTVPDKWFVTIEKVDEDGVKKQRRIEITKQEYETLKRGDWYSVQK